MLWRQYDIQGGRVISARAKFKKKKVAHQVDNHRDPR